MSMPSAANRFERTIQRDVSLLKAPATPERAGSGRATALTVVVWRENDGMPDEGRTDH
jgi:hypothetical protein